MKKIVSLLLVLTMVLGLATAVSAAGVGQYLTPDEGGNCSMTVAGGQAMLTLEAGAVATVEVTDSQNPKVSTYGYYLDANGDAVDASYVLMASMFEQYQSVNGVAEAALTMNSFRLMNTTEDQTIYVLITAEDGAPAVTGTMDNPTVLDSLGDYTAEDMQVTFMGMAGIEPHVYQWTADDTGLLVLSIDTASAEQWLYCVNNITAGKYGDTYISTYDDPSVYSMLVKKGDVIQFSVGTGSYTTAGTVDFNLALLGTESNPFQINTPNDLTSVTVQADSQTYLAVSSQLNGMILNITGDANTTVTVNGTAVTAVNGLFSVELTGAPTNKVVVGNKGDKDAEYVASIDYAPGTESNPIVVENASDLTSVNVAAGSETYIAVSSQLNGMILNIAGDENTTVTVNGKEITAVNGVFTVELTGTPTNQIVVSNKGNKDANYAASISYAPGTDVSAPIEIETASQLTGIDAPAGASVYYAVNSKLNGMILTINGDANTTVTLNGKELTAVNGVFTAELTGTPVNTLVVTNKGDKDAEYTAAIAYALGTAGNPIVVTTEKDLSGAKIEAGTETHYLVNSKLDGAVLSIKGEGVYVIVDGVKTEAKDGVIKLTLTAKNPTISVVIGNTGKAAVTVSFGYSDNPNTGDMGVLAPIAAMLASAMSTVALVAKKKEF